MHNLLTESMLVATFTYNFHVFFSLCIRRLFFYIPSCVSSVCLKAYCQLNYQPHLSASYSQATSSVPPPPSRRFHKWIYYSKVESVPSCRFQIHFCILACVISLEFSRESWNFYQLSFHEFAYVKLFEEILFIQGFSIWPYTPFSHRP